MGKMTLFDHSFNQLFLDNYEKYYRQEILFPLCEMKGEKEKFVLGHLLDHLGDLQSFIEQFYYYF